MEIPEYIIIIAISGRMLAQAVIKSGLKALVIDLFADLDMRGYATDFRLIQSLSIEHLAPAVDYFAKHYPVTDIIYGSGFEHHPDSLFYLHERFSILGNDPATFSRQLNKQEFFSGLDQLGIPYPEASFHVPVNENKGLVKPLQGHGGLGIRRYRENEAFSSSEYWQKYQPGDQHSVLFLANGQALKVIGFNRQWTVSSNEGESFIFSGLINDTELIDEEKKLLMEYLKKIVPFFNLKGINSLDFISDKGKTYVLEINPRPSASMQLYEGDLLVKHVQACQGVLPESMPQQIGVKGYQIVYALQDTVIPEHFEWPAGSMDLPGSGTIVVEGQPICSIIAQEKKAKAVLKQLSNLKHIVTNKLERFQAHAI